MTHSDPDDYDCRGGAIAGAVFCLALLAGLAVVGRLLLVARAALFPAGG